MGGVFQTRLLEGVWQTKAACARKGWGVICEAIWATAGCCFPPSVQSQTSGSPGACPFPLPSLCIGRNHTRNVLSVPNSQLSDKARQRPIWEASPARHTSPVALCTLVSDSCGHVHSTQQRAGPVTLCRFGIKHVIQEVLGRGRLPGSGARETRTISLKGHRPRQQQWCLNGSMSSRNSDDDSEASDG